jgi:hypothetical protein
MQNLFIGSLFGISPSIAYIIAEIGAPNLGSHTTISLGTVAAIAAVVIPAAVAITRKLQKLEDKIETFEQRFEGLYCVKHPECPSKPNE